MFVTVEGKNICFRLVQLAKAIPLILFTPSGKLTTDKLGQSANVSHRVSIFECICTKQRFEQ